MYFGVTPTTGLDQLHRYSLVVDRQVNGVLPAAGSHLTANTPAGVRSLVQRKRYKTLWDKTYCLNASTEPGSFRAVHQYFKLKRPLITEFNNGTAGTIADISTNALYFYLVGTLNAAGTTGLLYGTLRIRYTDM